MCSINRSKSWLFWGIVLSLIIITISCAEKKPFVWGSAETGYILSYRPKVGDVFVYKRTMEGSGTYERMGQTFESTSSRKFMFQLETEKVQDTLNTFILTVDTIGFFIESVRGKQEMDYGDIKGKRVRVTIIPKGEKREITLIDSLQTPEMDGRPMPGDPKDQLIVGFFETPDKSIKIGDSWTETKLDTSTRSDTTMQIDQTHITDREIKYMVLGEEKKMGLDCLHIRSDSKYATQSWGTIRGSEMNSEGEGESSSHIWFAYKEGILVEFTVDNFYEGTQAFSGQMSGTSASSNESKSSLKLLKWIPRKK